MAAAALARNPRNRSPSARVLLSVKPPALLSSPRSARAPVEGVRAARRRPTFKPTRNEVLMAKIANHAQRRPNPPRPAPTRSPRHATHCVNGNPLKPPFPAGLRGGRFRPRLLSGARSGSSGRAPGVWSTSCGLCRRRRRRIRPTKKCAPAQTGHTEVVRVIFDPKQISYESIAEALLRESTIRPKACAKAAMSERSIALPSTQHRTCAEGTRPRERTQSVRNEKLRAAGFGIAITTELRDAPEFFYAEALSPAVSG